jgi:hypothetical protein
VDSIPSVTSNRDKTYLTETIFSLCVERADNELFHFMYNDILLKQIKSQQEQQTILIETLLNKFRKSFEMNQIVIELILRHITDKQQLIQQFKLNHKLLDPTEHNFKNLSPLFHTLPTVITNNDKSDEFKNTQLFFTKHKLLVKYDIIPIEDRLYWLSRFVYDWALLYAPSSSSSRNPGRFIFIEPMIIKERYLNLNNIDSFVNSYYKWLLINGFLPFNNDKHLPLQSKINDLNILNQIETTIKSVYSTNRQKEPFSLMVLARSNIRNYLISLSDQHINETGLPKELCNYLKCSNF